MDKDLFKKQQTQQIIFCFVVSLIAFLGFINTIKFGYVYDDLYVVVKSEAVLQDLSLKNIISLFTTDIWAFLTKNLSDSYKGESSYYRPIFGLCLMVNSAYAGNVSWKWHLTSIILHIGATVLAYLLMVSTLLKIELGFNKNKASWLALIATIVFAVHPLQSESVAWISGYANALMAIFIFSSLLAYLKTKEVNLNRNKMIFWLLISLMFGTLALLTKETGVLIIGLVIFYELVIINKELSWQKRLTKTFLSGVPFFILLGIYFCLRIKLFGDVAVKQVNMDFIQLNNLPKEVKFFTIPKVFLLYLKNMVFPVNLSPFYPISMVFQANADFYLPTILLILLGVGFLLLWSKTLIVRVAVIWIVVPLIPVLLNINISNPDDLAHDRYAYFSLLGVGLLLAQGFYSLNEYLMKRENKELEVKENVWPLKTSLTVVLVGFFVVMIGSTIKQNLIWQDERSFWNAAHEVFPESCVINKELGQISFEDKLENQAIEYFEQAKKGCPYSVPVFQKLGILYANKREFELAEAQLQKLIEISPHPKITANAYYSLGYVYKLKKDKAQAIKSYQKSIELNPTGERANRAKDNIRELMAN